MSKEETPFKTIPIEVAKKVSEELKSIIPLSNLPYKIENKIFYSQGNDYFEVLSLVPRETEAIEDIVKKYKKKVYDEG